ncbi:MOSC domain-containing protein [Plasmodiophora brassicae]
MDRHATTTAERASFLARYPGYNADIEQFRRERMRQMDADGAIVYLDYAGFAPFTDDLADAHCSSLKSRQWANPHSVGVIGAAVTERVDRARHRILHMLNVTSASHTVIFAAGATAALKLVGETFPWSASSTFAYTQLNHNSVLGIREYALANGATAACLSDDYRVLASFRSSARSSSKTTTPSVSLMALPAECNFSGIRPHLDDINRMKTKTIRLPGAGTDYMILLDASKYCATAALDLSAVQADFTVVSFYKMFGLPTGLGALIVRNDAVSCLTEKRYFGGGTLDAVSVLDGFRAFKSDTSSRFEDGTVPFTLIDAVCDGIDLLVDELGLSRIGPHCSALTAYTVLTMRGLRHANGRPVFTVFGDHLTGESQSGPTISFTVLGSDGDTIGHVYVARLAALCGIQVRAGCFCNAGACQRFLGLSTDDIRAHLARGHVCGDDVDVIDGRPTGCVRISFGYASTYPDVAAWFQFVRTYLVKGDIERPVSGNWAPKATTVVKSLTFYPVKSCGPVNVADWSVMSNGALQFDRQWVVVGSEGRVMTQSHCKAMRNVFPSVDMTRGELVLRCDGLPVFAVPLTEAQGPAIDIRVCGQRRSAALLESSQAWLTKAIGIPCTLARVMDGADDNDMLLVSQSSVAWLSQNSGHVWSAQQFRPNIVVDGPVPAFAEEGWQEIILGDHLRFEVVKRCTRCTMIGTQSYQELCRLRHKPQFGVLVSVAADHLAGRSGTISTAMPVTQV